MVQMNDTNLNAKQLGNTVFLYKGNIINSICLQCDVICSEKVFSKLNKNFFQKI